MAMLVSIIILLVLLSCATVASVGIHQIVCRKIPIILSPPKWNNQFSWDKVEEHMVNSFILVRSANPHYILARSIFTSPIALIAAICIGINVHASLLETYLRYRNSIYLLSRLSCWDQVSYSGDASRQQYITPEKIVGNGLVSNSILRWRISG